MAVSKVGEQRPALPGQAAEAGVCQDVDPGRGWKRAFRKVDDIVALRQGKAAVPVELPAVKGRKRRHGRRMILLFPLHRGRLGGSLQRPEMRA
ncbi:hypothetical protein SDC9_193644 [bioreactor metagenome]|uniref:Uncharacterized protein n=1 Tax=bioreactor metagenome TaxID=1076179 RepID=A0A645ICP6_9ZZZZ